MTRHANVKNFDEEFECDDELDEETEYAIDRVLLALKPQKLRRDKVYNFLLKFDFCVESAIAELKQKQRKAPICEREKPIQSKAKAETQTAIRESYELAATSALAKKRRKRLESLRKR